MFDLAGTTITDFHSLLRDSERLSRALEARLPFEIQVEARNRPAVYRIQGVHSESSGKWTGTIQDVTLFTRTTKGADRPYYSGTASRALQLLIDNTEESFILIDHELRIVLFNRIFAERYYAAFQTEVIIGNYFLDYIMPERRELVAGFCRESLKGVAIMDEVEINVGDNFKSYLNNYKPAYDDDGNLYGLFLTSFDITARRNAERHLVNSEKRFRSLVENGGDAISILLPDGRPIYISPSIERVLGYTEQEAMQLNLFDIIHPTYVDKVKEAWVDLLERPGAATPDQISRIRHKDGSWRFIEATVTNLMHDPAVGGFVDNFRDVTARVIAAKEIAKTQALLIKAENLGQLGSGEINVKQNSLHWSDGMYRIHGMEPGGGITILQAIERIHPEDRQHFINVKDYAVASGRPEFDLEMRIVRADGVIRIVSVQAMIQYSEQKQAERIFAVVQDITERQQTASVLRKLNKEIEERAADLSRSNEELEQFAYVASHDLQEPLRMVSSFLQLLQRQYNEQLDEKASEYIAYAVDGANRMKRLILDLLEYSRVGTNKDSMVEVDLNVVLREISSMFDPKSDPPVQITVKPLPVILGVRSQLTQLFQNLIGNGLKYNTASVKEVEIGCKDLGGEWEFYVKDNGIGIDEKFYEKVFVIFQRLHNRNTYSGTGIGLAICKKIVERHGGDIRVESKPGEGSVFYFTILK